MLALQHRCQLLLLLLLSRHLLDSNSCSGISWRDMPTLHLCLQVPAPASTCSGALDNL